eukprot:COSAG03_NODE_3535_length_1961_cov_2.682062_3_plen_172_part_01
MQWAKSYGPRASAPSHVPSTSYNLLAKRPRRGRPRARGRRIERVRSTQGREARGIRRQHCAGRAAPACARYPQCTKRFVRCRANGRKRTLGRHERTSGGATSTPQGVYWYISIRCSRSLSARRAYKIAHAAPSTRAAAQGCTPGSGDVPPAPRGCVDRPRRPDRHRSADADQ